MEVLPELQDQPSTLNSLYVNSPITGQQVPLSTLVKWTTRPTTFLSINHQDQFPAVTLSFNLAPGVALGQAVAAVNAAEAAMGTPASLTGTFQGNAQAFQASLASEPYLVAAAIIVIYIILGVLYESYIHPLTILSTLPSAGVGALVTLMAFGFDFSLIALIGIILLIGIVKKNGIMLVDFAIEAERHRGLAPAAAIREACLLRFRPIMMTTMAALLGGVPLMLGTGTGSEIRQPLGYAIVGGLIVSQALTLYTTPVVYLYLDRVNQWLSRRRSGPAPRRGAGGCRVTAPASDRLIRPFGRRDPGGRRRRDRQDDLRSDLPVLPDLDPIDDQQERLRLPVLSRIGHRDVQGHVGFRHIRGQPDDLQLRQVGPKHDGPRGRDIVQLLVDGIIAPEPRPVAL